jgi:hypothetical protein
LGTEVIGLPEAGFGRHPSEQEEVPAAKGAPVGEKNPVDGSLDGVSGAYASKLDRSAIATAWREHNLE